MHRWAMLLGVYFSSTLIFTCFAQVSVPLVITTDSGTGVQRVGVYLKIGTSDTAQLFLLDTGSQSLILNGSTPLPASSLSLGQSSNISYGIDANNTFDFDTFSDTIYFSNANGASLATAANFAFAQVTSPEPIASGFAGIMGAGPSVDNFQDSNSGPSFNLFSIMGKVSFPDGMLPGFTLQLDPATGGGTLTIGVTPQQWAGVQIKFLMTPKNTTQPNFSADVPSYDGDQLTMQTSFYALDAGSSISMNGGTPMEVKLDTGAPETVVVLDTSDIQKLLANYLGPQSNSLYPILTGTEIDLQGTNGEFALRISNDSRAASGSVQDVNSGSYIHVNTGIAPFNNYTITFLFADSEGQGWVGFQSPHQPPLDLQIILKKKRILTRNSSVRLHGGASADTVRVIYRSKFERKWRNAKGSGSWSFRAHLREGRNVFWVKAVSNSGEQSQAYRIIVRRVH